MRSYGRIAISTALALMLAGCFHPESADWDSLSGAETLATDSGVESVSASGVSTVTGHSGVTSESGDSSTGGGGSGTGTTGGGESDTVADDAPPEIVGLSVNGKEGDVTILNAGPALIKAIAVDDHPVARVDFFLDDKILGSDDVPPFEWTLDLTTDSMNGDHSIAAVAVDTIDQLSEPASLLVDVSLPVGGTQIWQAVGDDKYESQARGVALDSHGDVIVVGYQAVSQQPDQTRMAIRKYRGSDGELLWEREVPTALEEPAPVGLNIARGVAVDSHDNIFVVGQVDPSGGDPSFWLGKYTGGGLRIAEQESALPDSRGYGVAVDSADRVFGVGFGVKFDLTTTSIIAAYDSNLKPLWNKDFTAISDKNNGLHGVRVDSQDNVVIVGWLAETAELTRGLVAKFSATGNMLWWRSAAGELKPHDDLFGVSIGEGDAIYGIGRRVTKDFEEALWLLRLDANGNEEASEPDIVGRCGIEGCGIAIDPSGHILVAGASLNQGTGLDFMVKKLDAGWADVLWVAALDGYDSEQDRSLAVAVDQSGFVYGVGYEGKLGSPEWWVAKFNP